MLSFRIGGLLPDSVLVAMIQRDGHLDVLLRQIELELQSGPPDPGKIYHFHFYMMFAEIFVCGLYARLQNVLSRKLTDDAAYVDLRLASFG
jgi:hypothetical protein